MERPHASLEGEQAGEEVGNRLRLVESAADPVRALEPAVERVHVARRARAGGSTAVSSSRQAALLVDHALDLARPVDHRLGVRQRVAVPLGVVAKALERHDRDLDVRARARRLVVRGVAHDAHVVVGIRPHICVLAARAAEEEADDAVVRARPLDQLLDTSGSTYEDRPAHEVADPAQVALLVVPSALTELLGLRRVRIGLEPLGEGQPVKRARTGPSRPATTRSG